MAYRADRLVEFRELPTQDVQAAHGAVLPGMGRFPLAWARGRRSLWLGQGLH